MTEGHPRTVLTTEDPGPNDPPTRLNANEVGREDT